MKVIIAGGRDFTDSKYFMECINSCGIHITEIVCGKAKGADTLGEILANSNDNLILKEFPANWPLYGISAGHIRNKEMAEYADVLIAFRDGKSAGTHNMIKIAKELNLEIKIYNY